MVSNCMSMSCTKNQIKLRTNRFGGCAWLRSKLLGGWGVLFGRLWSNRLGGCGRLNVYELTQSFSPNFVGFYTNSIYFYLVSVQMKFKINMFS